MSQVIADQGVTALSLRTVGAVSRVSASGLVAQFGNRERMLEVSAMILGQSRIEAIRRRRHEGAGAFLPASEEDVVDLRVWLGLCELGRAHEVVGYRIDDARQEERGLLRWTIELARADAPNGAADAGLDLLMAVLDGLNARLCDPAAPMPVARARELLTACEERLLGPGS